MHVLDSDSEVQLRTNMAICRPGKHYNAAASVCHILAAESELSDSVCVCHSTVPQSHTLAAAAMIGRRAGSRCVPDSNECHSLVTSLVCGLKFEVEYTYIEN